MTREEAYRLGFIDGLRRVRDVVVTGRRQSAALDLGEPPGRVRAAFLAALDGVEDALFEMAGLFLTERKGLPEDPEKGGSRTEGAAPESALDRRQIARERGYTGDACGECSNFTLVRNGTCLKCDSCGATTGCS